MQRVANVKRPPGAVGVSDTYAAKEAVFASQLSAVQMKVMQADDARDG